MFGIGGFEFFLIIVFVFLIFGPDKFPEIAGKIGRLAARFKAARAEVDPAIKADVQAVTNAAMNETDMPAEPFKDSIDALDRAVATMTEPVHKKKVVRVKSTEEQDAIMTPKQAPVQSSQDTLQQTTAEKPDVVQTVMNPNNSFAARRAARLAAAENQQPEETKEQPVQKKKSTKTTKASTSSGKKTSEKKAPATKTSEKTATNKTKPAEKKTSEKKTSAKKTPAKKTTSVSRDGEQ